MSGVNEFIKSIGIITEMTKVFYEHYQRVGFTQQQALDLAKSMTIAQMQIAAFMPKNGSEEF